MTTNENQPPQDNTYRVETGVAIAVNTAAYFPLETYISGAAAAAGTRAEMIALHLLGTAKLSGDFRQAWMRRWGVDENDNPLYRAIHEWMQVNVFYTPPYFAAVSAMNQVFHSAADTERAAWQAIAATMYGVAVDFVWGKVRDHYLRKSGGKPALYGQGELNRNAKFFLLSPTQAIAVARKAKSLDQAFAETPYAKTAIDTTL